MGDVEGHKRKFPLGSWVNRVPNPVTFLPTPPAPLNVSCQTPLHPQPTPPFKYHLHSSPNTSFSALLLSTYTSPSFFSKPTYLNSIAMGNEVIIEDIVIPQEDTLTKPLSLVGHGVTEIEIHFLQIRHTVIGVYMESGVVSHLQKWKGKSGRELAGDDDFFEALAAAPVETVIRVYVIKEIKASQYGSLLEGAVRDRLAAADKYEEEEEEALDKAVQFFPTKYLKKGASFTFKFPASGPAQMVLTVEGKEEASTTVENANVAETLKKWYLGGTRGVSPSTIDSIANNLSAELSK